MAKGIGQYDGAILGALLGAVIFYPVIGEKINAFVTGIIPTSWYVFGAYSLAIFGIAAGALIGYIMDRS